MGASEGNTWKSLRAIENAAGEGQSDLHYESILTVSFLKTYTQDGDDVYSIAESCQRLAIIVQTMSVEVADDERTKSSSELLESMWALYEYVLL